MPFFDNIANISNYYNGFKSSVAQIFNVAKKVIHGVRSGGDWIDDKLNTLSSIPYLGTATQEAVKKAKDYKVFGIASYNDVMGYTRWIDDTLQHSDIAESLAQTADYYISPVVETASKIGQSMGGNVQSSPYGAGVIAAG